MIQLYDKNHVKVEGLTKYKDYNIESVLSSGDKTLSFSYPTIYTGNIQEEGYIRTKTAEFVIKSIEGKTDRKTIKATLNVEDLEGKPWDRFDSTEQTITACLNLALAGTGWSVGACNVTKLRTVRKTGCSAWDIVQEAVKTYRAEAEFDTLNKKINIYDKMGSDKGAYFIDSLNLKELTVQSNSYSYYTRIQAVGKGGLTLPVPGYVENYQYSNKIKTLYWKDERYTDIASLTEDSTLKLDDLSKPYRAYGADIIDLASNNDKYKDIPSYGLGDIIALISKDLKVKEKQRIAKIVEYPEEPERNTCDLANVILSFEDIQKENQDTTDTVNNITSDDGTVSEDAITKAVANLTVGKADIQDLNAVTIRVGTLEATTATITQLNAVQANIDTLNTNKANVTDLTAATGRITTLEVNSATITQLNAQVARIGTLETTTAHITNGIIDNATIDVGKINNLSSTYATITNLTASNGRITTLEATTASINNLLAGNIEADNLAAGAIQAGSAVIANGAIASAQIISLDVGKINAGDISTTKFRLVSDSGNMLMSDNTIQISDATRVRVQIGKDASNDYNMYVWDASGNLMFDATGLKAGGIKTKIIRDDMVSDTANINGGKIEKESLVTQVNGATTLLKASHVKLDTEAQTLDVAFTGLKSTVTSQGTTISSQGTDISTIQGQISSKVWSTDITTAVNGLQTQIDTHTTEISQNTSNISLKASQSSLNTTNANVTTAQNTANSKKRVFTSQPVPPYDLGDLWVSTLSTGSSYICTTVRSTGSYTASDWTKDSATQRLTTAEASITVNTGQISAKVWSTDITTAADGLQSQIDTHSTDIDAISSDVGDASTNIDDLSTRITTAESSIIQNSGDISLKTDKTEFDSLKGVVNQNTSELKLIPDKISASIRSTTDTANTANTGVATINSYMDFTPDGLVLGKEGGENDNLKVKITNSEMDFLDNGTKVAYISNKQMEIDKAKILTSIIVGNHQIEKYNTDITLIKWVGGAV